MKGATYVTVEADAAFVMPMNASGGQIVNGYTVRWTSEGITDIGWEFDGVIVVKDPKGNIGAQINAFLEEHNLEFELPFLNAWSANGCAV